MEKNLFLLQLPGRLFCVYPKEGILIPGSSGLAYHQTTSITSLLPIAQRYDYALFLLRAPFLTDSPGVRKVGSPCPQHNCLAAS